MEYNVKQIKKGIKIHVLNTDKFKTNLVAIFLTTKLNRENVTKNALISMLLRRGSKNITTQEEISKKMEELYGASFDCGLDKTGDNQVLKFYIETINDGYLPKHSENILNVALKYLFDIVFNPYIENGGFKKEYVEQEKNTLEKRINGKKDNKSIYAINRFGYVENLDKIDEKGLYEYYKYLINSCKIDIFISGNCDKGIEKVIEADNNIRNLKERTPDFVVPNIEKENNMEEKIVNESMEVTQGKLVLGLNLNIDNNDEKYIALMYNSIFGGSANSKLFQNVREKAHLAYVASSNYYRFKNIVIVNSGIEISNYEKALELIKKQIEEMKEGKFTEEEIENGKKGIIAAIKTISDEQDTGVTYYFGQELSGTNVSEEEYIKKIENITKEDIINVANKVKINTIYFLKN